MKWIPGSGDWMWIEESQVPMINDEHADEWNVWNCVLKNKIVIIENVVFPKNVFSLNSSLTNFVTYILSFSSPGCQALKLSKEWMSAVEAK